MTTTAKELGYSELPRQRRPLGWALRNLIWLATGIAWAFFAAVMVAGAVTGVAAALGSLAGGAAPIGMILLLFIGATLARGARRVRDLSVLHYLEQAVRMNAPLVGMVGAAERSERGSVRARLRRLRVRLEAGDSVAAAITIAAPGLAERIKALIGVGEKTGRLAAAMRRVTARRDFMPAQNPTNWIFSRWYPLVAVAGCIIIAQTIIILIMPKYEQMMKDFRMPPPVGAAWRPYLYGDFTYVLYLSAGVLILLVCGWLLAQWFTPRGVTLGPLKIPVDAVLWFTPVFGGVAKNRAMGDICHVLANALDAGMPAADAIAQAAGASGNFILRRRMRRWAGHCAAGTDLAPAAKTARLPRLLTGLLATADTTRQTQEVFEFLCHYYDSRFSRAATLLRAAVIPAMTVCVGVVVAALALSVFEPMIAWVNKLTGH